MKTQEQSEQKRLAQDKVMITTVTGKLVKGMDEDTGAVDTRTLSTPGQVLVALPRLLGIKNSSTMLFAL